VVWAVAKGSLRNKAILVPGRIVGQRFRTLGGVAPADDRGYVSVFSKAWESWSTSPLMPAGPLPDPNADLTQLERDKIKGAVRTDFVLSAEIIAITLGAVVDTSMPARIGVLVGIALS